MRLDAVTLRLVRLPLRHPFVTAKGRQDTRQAIILTLHTEEGVGWGECSAGSVPGYTPEKQSDAWDWYTDAAQRHLGKQLPDPKAFFSSLDVHTHLGLPMTVAGWEMALWDLQGKSVGKSLAELLGARRRRVSVGLALGLFPDVKSLLDAALQGVENGYRRLKIKIAPGHDLELLDALRQVLPEIALQVDANESYSRADLPVLQRLDDYNLLLIEQPFPAEDWGSHRWLQARLRTPLCLDEGIQTAQDARKALRSGACRALNIKPARVGGLFSALEVSRVGQSHGALLWVGGMLESGIGRAASLALAACDAFTLPPDLSASDRYYPQDVIIPPFRLNAGGTLDVPAAPGLGVVVDEKALEHFTVRKEYFGRRRL